jgi:serine/threonine protein kinase
VSASLAQLHRDALPAGTLLNGYQIVGVLGRGGFGITYRASDLLDQAFAIKEFFPRQFAMRMGQDVVVTSDSDAEIFIDCRKRFLTEARLLASLGRDGGTPGIVRVATFFEANNTAYSVMELLVGETLDDVLKNGRTPMTADPLLSLLRGILTPLTRVHAAGFLHRDIKPANILIRPDGSPVLIDFGSARDIGPSAATTYTQVYSGHYAPIEQMITGAAQGPFSDIFSVGCVAYRAIGGNLIDARARQQAVLSRAPDPLVPAVQVGSGRYPRPLLAAVDRTLALRAADRPQSIAELLELMDRPAEQEEIPTRRARMAVGSTPAASRTSPRRSDQASWRAAVSRLRQTLAQQRMSRPQLGLAAAVLAVIIVGLAAWYVIPGRGRDQLAALHVSLTTGESGVTAKFPETTDRAAFLKALPQLVKLRVTALDLSNTRIGSLPPLQQLFGLQKLDLSGSNVEIVESLDGLSLLRELDLAHTKITSLPPLHDLTALRKLDLSNTPITTLPPLDALTALQELDLSHTNIATLPPLERLAELRRLDLTDSGIRSLAPAGWLRHVQVVPPDLVVTPEPAPEQRLATSAPPPAPAPAPTTPEPESSSLSAASNALKAARQPTRPPPPPAAALPRPPSPPPKAPEAAPQQAPAPPANAPTAGAGKPSEQAGEPETSRTGYEYFQQGFAASEMRNYAEARTLFSRGAEKGEEHCMYYLGHMYEYGLGVTRDYAQAESWYKRAADRGYRLAFYNVGLLHLGGGPGMPRDCNAARVWFEKAATHGISAAQTWLAANTSCQ